ncbi:unnamed protein product [Heligmosomoides polygyrus]|uniref:NR LBD domain-containing protein n=1 Tax=Heligmosomoides polygyrus TaxID=6339 RepID=A0A183GIJ8_HELPZ|nr:unnamed protein product [Heligmosomoides polygyrus]
MSDGARPSVDFSVSRLITPSDEYALHSLVHSWSSSAPMLSICSEDKKVCVTKNTRHYILDIEKCCGTLSKSWHFFASLQLSPAELWSISSILLFRPEDHRLRSPKTIRELQMHSAAVLASCLSARTAVQGAAQSAALLLVLPTISQVLPEDMRRHFFADRQLSDVEHICASAVI